MRKHLNALLDDARACSSHGFGLPRLVDDEFRGFLACGVLACG